jgi:DNA-binding CsgD family transcriptional regulator
MRIRREEGSLLTAPQRRILILKANGMTDREIGDDLGIRAASASTNLVRIYRKLGASGAPQAVAIALALGEIGVHQIDIPTRQEAA